MAAADAASVTPSVSPGAPVTCAGKPSGTQQRIFDAPAHSPDTVVPAHVAASMHTPLLPLAVRHAGPVGAFVVAAAGASVTDACVAAGANVAVGASVASLTGGASVGPGGPVTSTGRPSGTQQRMLDGPAHSPVNVSPGRLRE